METREKYTIYKQVFVVFAFILANSIAYSQCDFFTDFESGTLTDWSILAGTNIVSTQQVHTGNYALKMSLSASYPSIISIPNNFSFGRYTAWFWVTGPYSAAFLRFHYQDSNNFYQVGMMPQNTDNPNLTVAKWVNGTHTMMQAIPPVFDINTWFKMTVERFDNGDIKVYINNNLQIALNDPTFMLPSQIIFLGYDFTTYMDDFCYERFTDSSLIDLGDDVIACEGDIVHLNAGSELMNYVWNNGLAYGNTIDVSATGVYSVQAVDSLGVTFSDSIFVFFNPIPYVDLGDDTIVCPGEMVDLYSNNLGYSYLWSTGETSSSITVNSSGTYWLTVSSQNCSSTDSITINSIMEFDSPFDENKVMCEGGSVYLDAKNQGCIYLWSTGETNQAIEADHLGVYSVMIKKDICSITYSVEVSILPYPEVSLGGDITLCGGNSILLDAGNPGSGYLWSTGETTQTIDVGGSNQVVWVEVTQNGCTTKDAISFFECENNYGVPMGFSPNNDGENDILYVYGQNILEMEFSVFNRFGQLVFTSDRQDIGWDGTYRGKDCEMDVYAWLLKLKFYNGRAISDQGNVSLLR